VTHDAGLAARGKRRIEIEDGLLKGDR